MRLDRDTLGPCGPRGSHPSRARGTPDFPEGCLVTGRFLANLVLPLALAQGAIPEVAPARDTNTLDSAGAEWRSYGGDAAQNRFSSLSAINRQTIGRLGLGWALELPNETNLVATPLAVDGLLYFPGKF